MGKIDIYTNGIHNIAVEDTHQEVAYRSRFVQGNRIVKSRESFIRQLKAARLRLHHHNRSKSVGQKWRNAMREFEYFDEYVKFIEENPTLFFDALASHDYDKANNKLRDKFTVSVKSFNIRFTENIIHCMPFAAYNDMYKNNPDADAGTLDEGWYGHLEINTTNDPMHNAAYFGYGYHSSKDLYSMLGLYPKDTLHRGTLEYYDKEPGDKTRSMRWVVRFVLPRAHMSNIDKQIIVDRMKHNVHTGYVYEREEK